MRAGSESRPLLFSQQHPFRLRTLNSKEGVPFPTRVCLRLQPGDAHDRCAAGGSGGHVAVHQTVRLAHDQNSGAHPMRRLSSTLAESALARTSKLRPTPLLPFCWRENGYNCFRMATEGLERGTHSNAQKHPAQQTAQTARVAPLPTSLLRLGPQRVQVPGCAPFESQQADCLLTSTYSSANLPPKMETCLGAGRQCLHASNWRFVLLFWKVGFLDLVRTDNDNFGLVNFFDGYGMTPPQEQLCKLARGFWKALPAAIIVGNEKSPAAPPPQHASHVRPPP